MANKKTVHHRNQITALILWMRCFGRHNNKPPPSGGFFTPERRDMNQLDPVNVAIALASVIFGPALAGVVGPYAVILIASTVGAAWALGRRDQSARLGAAWYFLRLNATAVLITAGLASLAGRWLGSEDTTWMLAPIALLVGGVGDDWPRLARWCFSRVGQMVERRTGGGDGGAS